MQAPQSGLQAPRVPEQDVLGVGWGQAERDRLLLLALLSLHAARPRVLAAVVTAPSSPQEAAR